LSATNGLRIMSVLAGFVRLFAQMFRPRFCRSQRPLCVRHTGSKTFENRWHTAQTRNEFIHHDTTGKAVVRAPAVILLPVDPAVSSAGCPVPFKRVTSLLSNRKLVPAAVTSRHHGESAVSRTPSTKPRYLHRSSGAQDGSVCTEPAS
jgi:hypothetical protein